MMFMHCSDIVNAGHVFGVDVDVTLVSILMVVFYCATGNLFESVC